MHDIFVFTLTLCALPPHNAFHTHKHTHKHMHTYKHNIPTHNHTHAHTKNIHTHMHAHATQADCTPLDLALENGWEEVAAALLDAS